MKLSPEGCKVLVLPDTVEEMTKGGLFLPETVQADEQYAVTIGKVIAIGPGVEAYFDDGELKVGDRVHYSKYSGKHVEGNDVVYRVINDEDIHLRED